MKILQIFNPYVNYGGEESAVNQISVELEKGHELHSVVFDIQRWADGGGLLKRLQQLALMVWNPASMRTVRDAITEFKPDVILLHNIMPVGSAVLYFHLSRCGIPLVHYIHNFRPFSVNGYCWGNGKLLPQGLEKNYLPEICAGAWQDSRFKTAWYAFLIWSLHQVGVYQRIDGWIAISKFMKETFVKGGIDENRIEVISHSWAPQCGEEELSLRLGQEQEPLFLFLGRINEEKGLPVLLDAWKVFEKSSATGRLVIAGEGPLAAEVEQRCGELKRVSYVGFQSGEAKKQLLRDCTALVVPSVWWEPLGLVLYEAYDYGKPVLAARSGGIVDHVEDGVTGWLHEPGDHTMLAEQMLAANADRDNFRSRGAAGRKLLLARNQGVWINQFNEFVARIIANPGRARPARRADEIRREEKPARTSNVEEKTIRVDSRSFAVPPYSPEAEESVTAARAGADLGRKSKILNTKSETQHSKSEIPPPESSSIRVDSRSFAVPPSSPEAEESITAARAGAALPALDQTSNIEGKTIRVDSRSFAVSPSHRTSNVERPTSKEENRRQPRDAAATLIPESKIQNPKSKIQITAYLADQNPGYDRSFGISRMSQVVLDALASLDGVTIEAITSKTSQQPPANVTSTCVLPWGTRAKWIRLLTDHFHPLYRRPSKNPDVYYFPKGYLPLLSFYCRPSVVTIHDTIIQYDEDHYPEWRHPWEYAYWSKMLKHTLLNADRIMTVSESSKAQIERFMARHSIRSKPIIVTYEPCLYESLEQPVEPHKENYVIHLASSEPHKRTAHLIRWWHEAEMMGRELPTLHLIGSVPEEVVSLLADSHSIVRRAFLLESALQAVYLEARALILPSEIEGFGLPALEAYYLGTPVCFVRGTSVEEVLGVATCKGGFSLDQPESLFSALAEVMRMSPGEVRECGLKLREVYAAEKVVERMMAVFHEVKDR